MGTAAGIAKTRRMAISKCIGLWMVWATAAAAAEFAFPAGDAVVRVKVEMLPAYTGTPLVLYADGREIPAAALGFEKRPEQFIGAGALVTYSLEFKGRKRKATEVRERVELLGQSEGLPARETFHKTVRFVRGVASDLQLFGYDEGAVAAGERAGLREASRGLWRRFRQELFLDGSETPFAVLEWRHTLTEVTVGVAER